MSTRYTTKLLGGMKGRGRVSLGTLLGARPRFHLHFTPTYSSWLNQVERWFALLSQRQIRRGSFVSSKDLVAKIETFVDAL